MKHTVEMLSLDNITDTGLKLLVMLDHMTDEMFDGAPPELRKLLVNLIRKMEKPPPPEIPAEMIELVAAQCALLQCVVALYDARQRLDAAQKLVATRHLPTGEGAVH